MDGHGPAKILFVFLNFMDGHLLGVPGDAGNVDYNRLLPKM
jgi:hypothetical protein